MAKRHILLVSKECTSCEETKRDFTSKYFGYGEIIDIDSPEGQKLAKEHQVEFVPLELELEVGETSRPSWLRREEAISAAIQEALRGCADRCIGAGVMIGRDAKEDAVWYPVNVRGLVEVTDMVVPHSELAMHVGAAGQRVLAWVLKEDYAYIVFEDRNGCCGYTHGLPNEVLSHGILRAMERIRA